MRDFMFQTSFQFIPEECVCPWASWTVSPNPSRQQEASRKAVPKLQPVAVSPLAPGKGRVFPHTSKVTRSRQSSRPWGPWGECLVSDSVLQIVDLGPFSPLFFLITHSAFLSALTEITK